MCFTLVRSNHEIMSSCYRVTYIFFSKLLQRMYLWSSMAVQRRVNFCLWPMCHFSSFFGFKTDEHTFSQRQSLDQERGWRKRQYDEMAEGRAVDGSNGNKMTREGRIASDDQRFEGNDIWHLRNVTSSYIPSCTICAIFWIDDKSSGCFSLSSRFRFSFSLTLSWDNACCNLCFRGCTGWHLTV